jgi:hypothetical protein
LGPGLGIGSQAVGDDITNIFHDSLRNNILRAKGKSEKEKKERERERERTGTR